MKLSRTDLRELSDLAILAATEAGQMIARARPGDVRRKAAGASLASQVVTKIDRQSEDIIVDVLGPTLSRFGLGLLTEEQHDDQSRLTADYFWCIDPLDGTLPFIEGVPGYAVSIALVGRDGTPWVGVIYDPVEATVSYAIKGGGAFRDGGPWSIEPRAIDEADRPDVLCVFADRSLVARDDHDVLVEALGQIAQDMGQSGVQLVATRGAVMNACGVLANSPACYFKFEGLAGGGSLWDFAAAACLFQELGLVATDIHGDRLDLNREDSTFMNHRGVLFATDEALASRVRALAASTTAGG